MEISSYIILGAIFMVGAYFMGCISPATILARAKGIDIRKEGSGNPGTTNVLRVVGKKEAAVTLLGDVLKGVFAVLLGSIAGPVFAYGCAVLVIIGHMWPFQFKFRGGKGVATALGVILTVNPLLALAVLCVFVIAVAATRYVSLGSCLGALAAPVCALWIEPGFFWFVLVIAILVIIKHRANLKRLVKGEESKLSFRK